MNTQAEHTSADLPKREHRQGELGSSVKNALQLFFNNLDGQKPTSIYQMVMAEVEQPMLETVMEYAKGNQSKAAQIMGISRSTLRKKLKKYQITFS